MADEKKVEGTEATTLVVEKKDNLLKRVGKGMKNLVCLTPDKAARLKELELDPVTQELEQLRKERGKKILFGTLAITGVVFGVNTVYQKLSNKSTTGDEPVADVDYTETPSQESSEQQ